MGRDAKNCVKNMQRLNADKYKPVLFADGEVGEIGGVSFGVIIGVIIILLLSAEDEK